MDHKPLLTITEKAVFVAKDLEASSEVKQSNLYFNDQPYIEVYLPSKRLLEIMSEHEIDEVMQYLQKMHFIKYEKKYNNLGGQDAYGVFVFIAQIRQLTKDPEQNTYIPPTVSVGIQFDKVRSVLTVNGTEILLGRAEGSKSLQYWVVFCTYPKPNKAVQELTILEKYDKENGDIARKRAVRDAVIALNKKITTKAQVKKDPFIYSNGKVTYVEQETNPYQFVSVNV